MDINLSLSPAPGIISDYLVVAVYEATAPTTLVQSQPFSAPHTDPENVVFTGLNPVPHLVICYQSPTTDASGIIRHNFIYNPEYKNAVIRLDLFVTAGITSGVVAGAASVTDTSLKDWDFGIERRGYGTMERGADYSFDNATGTWALLKFGDVIISSETFIFHFQPKITTVTPLATVTNGVLFSDALIKTTDATLDSTYMGKCILLQGASDHFTVTLPTLSAVPDVKLFGFISEGGSHVSAKLLCAGSDTINFLGSVSEIYLHQSEQIFLFKKNGVWNVLMPDGNFKTVGEVVYSYLQNEINTVFANGAELDRVIYGRLFDYVQSLDISAVVSDADWSNVALNNKGKYSLGNGTTTFRVPLLYTPGYLRGVDGTTRKAGSYQADDVKPHGHALNTSNSPATGGSDTDPVRGSIEGDPSDRGAEATIITGDVKSVKFNSGVETTPKNTGIYLLIRC